MNSFSWTCLYAERQQNNTIVETTYKEIKVIT